MAEISKNALQCAAFENELTEALDGKLNSAELETFQAHSRACPTCGPLFAEADAGLRWLKSLEEVEPPTHLLENILVATSGIDTARIGAIRAGQSNITWWEQFRDWSGTILAPTFAFVRQPRFAMSFGMAFFSLSVSLSLAGVKLGDLRHVDLRPSAVKRNYYETSGRIVKYYDNIRFVYEIESRVREFKRATTPVEPAPEVKTKGRHDNTSEKPEKRQDRNYSQQEGQPILAATLHDSPVVIVNTDRRFS